MADIVTGFGGVALGFVLSYFGTWLRDKRQEKQQKRSLAGALAAELRGLQAVLPDDEAAVDTWLAEQSYCSVFDASADHLGILGTELTAEAIACYATTKRCLDQLRGAQAMMQEVRVQGNPAITQANSMRERAFREAEHASQAIEPIAVKLEKTAAGGH